MFTETNPDKGTETSILMYMANMRWCFRFTETNPDKGTETVKESDYESRSNPSLQKLTPIRGRKP